MHKYGTGIAKRWSSRSSIWTVVKQQGDKDGGLPIGTAHDNPNQTQGCTKFVSGWTQGIIGGQHCNCREPFCLIDKHRTNEKQTLKQDAL
jgi:hypothetical protein